MEVIRPGAKPVSGAPGSPPLMIVIIAESLLLSGSESGEVLVSVTVLLSLGGVAELFTTVVIVTMKRSLSVTVSYVRSIVFPELLSVEAAGTDVTPVTVKDDGIVSRTLTPVAIPGPLFVISSVKVTVSPTCAVVGSPDFVTAGSVINAAVTVKLSEAVPLFGASLLVTIDVEFVTVP